MATSDQRLLVIGVRSLIGRRLREALSNRPEIEAYFTSRKPAENPSLIFDLTRPETFNPDLNFSTVIVCAPIWLTNVALLNRLYSLGMRRLIAFSSTSRFSKIDSTEVAEREVVDKLAKGEESIIDFCAKRDVDYTLLRPTLIYDEGHDENVSQIAGFIRRRGFFPVCGAASGRRQPVHARDLAIAALQAIDAPASFNRSYNLSGGETLSYHAMVTRIFTALGRPSRIWALPVWSWRLAFWGLDIVRPQKALKRNINMALRMNVDLVFDHAEATLDFGYAPSGFAPELRAE